MPVPHHSTITIKIRWTISRKEKLSGYWKQVLAFLHARCPSYGIIDSYTPPPQPFYGPFSGITQVRRYQKKASSVFKVLRANTPTIRLGATPSILISNPPPSIPPFLRWMPFLPQPPPQFILAFGTGTGICWITHPHGLPSVLWHCWMGGRKGIVCKKWEDGGGSHWLVQMEWHSAVCLC